MAKYYVNCKKCGKKNCIELFGKHKDRERELKYMESCCDFGEKCNSENEDNILKQ